ncbi:hypothetical protein [Chryseobacterium limigenitum]|nr:hypothetical protein [Chryseobacterium limigenitum]
MFQQNIAELFGKIVASMINWGREHRRVIVEDRIFNDPYINNDEKK